MVKSQDILSQLIFETMGEFVLDNERVEKHTKNCYRLHIKGSSPRNVHFWTNTEKQMKQQEGRITTHIKEDF